MFGPQFVDTNYYVGQKQIVVPSENDIFEISKESDPNSSAKLLIG